MQFSIKEWRRMYDKVHSLTKMLNNSRPTYSENGVRIEPVTSLSKKAQLCLEMDIVTLTRRCSKYLDACGMYMKKPLWRYNQNNSETWASAPEFKYGHLLKLEC